MTNTHVNDSIEKANQKYCELSKILRKRDLDYDSFSDILYRFISEGFNINYRPNEKSMDVTLLMLAIFEYETVTDDIVRLMLKVGADVNLTDADDWNALMLAINFNRSAKLISEILEKTDNINQISKAGRSAFGICSRKYISSRMFRKPNDASYLLEIVKLLLQAGADPYLDSTWREPWTNDLSSEGREKINDIIKYFNVMKETINPKPKQIYDYDL